MAGITLAEAWVQIKPSTKGLGAALNDQMVAPVGAASKAAGTSMSKGMVGGIAKIGSALAAVGVASFLKDSVDKAMVAEKSWAQLSQAVGNTGTSFKGAESDIKATLSAQSQLSAFSGGELRTGLTGLVQVTGDLGKSQKLLALTTDLARAKTMDMATASKLVGRVAMGSTAILTRYGIVLKKGATATEALAAMQKKFGGAAEAYGNTTQGQVDKANNAIGRLQVTIGTSLLPSIGRFADAGTQLLGEFDKWTPAAKDNAVALAGIGAAALIAAPYVSGLGKAFGLLGGTAAFKWLAGAATATTGAFAAIGASALLLGGDTSKAVSDSVTAADRLAVAQRALAEAQQMGGVSAEHLAQQQAYVAKLEAEVGSAADASRAQLERTFPPLVAIATGSARAAAAQVGLTTSVDGTTAAWAEQVLLLSDAQHGQRSLTSEVVSAHSAEKARIDYLKGGGKKGTAEYNDLVNKTVDAQGLAAQTAATMTDKQINAAVKSGVLSKAQGTLAKKSNDAAVAADGVNTALGKLPSSKNIAVNVHVNDSQYHSWLASFASVSRSLNLHVYGSGKPLASGGYVTQPGLHPIAENRPEYVIDPLNANGPALISAAARDAGMVAAAGRAVVNIVNHYNIPATIKSDIDIRELAKKLAAQQQIELRVMGVFA